MSLSGIHRNDFFSSNNLFILGEKNSGIIQVKILRTPKQPAFICAADSSDSVCGSQV